MLTTRRTTLAQQILLACLACASLILSGCSEPDETASPEAPSNPSVSEEGHGHSHDHDAHGHGEGSHPETYEEAVEAVVKIDETIKNAFAAKDQDTAHGPLHDIGHVLEEVNELALKAEMTDEQRASVKEAVEKLFDAFGAVDATMHGKVGKSYSQVSAEIEAAIAVLKEACGKEEASGE